MWMSNCLKLLGIENFDRRKRMAYIVSVCEFDGDVFANGRGQYDAFNNGFTRVCCHFETNATTDVRTLCHSGWTCF